MAERLTFYVLTSHNIYALKRHTEVSRIPLHLLKVIINSLDTQFILEAVTYCVENDIDFIVTESNGTAPKGKNSFLDAFLASDNEYAVLIDGDDFLTPHGVAMYRLVASTRTPPDVIALENQISLFPAVEQYSFADNNTKNPDDIKYEIAKNFAVADDDWEAAQDPNKIKSIIKERIHEDFFKNYDENITEAIMNQWVDNQVQMLKLTRDTVGKTETHSRVTFISKKAARYRFHEDLTVGEDTINFLELKDAAMRKELTMCVTDEQSPTYIYDMRLSSIAGPNCSSIDGFISWSSKFVSRLKELQSKNMLHPVALPDLKVGYPIGYKSDYVLPEIPEFEFVAINHTTGKTTKLLAPANSTDRYLNSLLQSVSQLEQVV